MKAILMSIKPKYVAKILNGEKTIEIRKTMPKCDLPIDVYIYCTKDKGELYIVKNQFDKNGDWKKHFECCKGKVVAKFTLYYVGKLKVIHDDIYDNMVAPDICITHKELEDYLKDNVGYAWHISQLEIFDKPKELSEFYPYCKDEKCEYRKNHCSICYRTPLTKAPQSWQFIEKEN